MTLAPMLDIERDFRTMFERMWPGEFRPTGLSELRIVTDVHWEEGRLMVTAEMPGIDPEKDVEVKVEPNLLTLIGTKSDDREVEKENMILHERRYGHFERRIVLPDGVDPDAVTATYDKGVLTVEVPLPEVTVAESRSIPVAAKA